MNPKSFLSSDVRHSRVGVTAIILLSGLVAACPQKPNFDNGDGGIFFPDSGTDAGHGDACNEGCLHPDSGPDAHDVDGGDDDGGTPDSGIDGGEPDGGEPDSGVDGGADAGVDGGTDAGTPDGGVDAGPVCPAYMMDLPTLDNFAPLGSTCDVFRRRGSCADGLQCIHVTQSSSIGVCGVPQCATGPGCADDALSYCVSGSPTACLRQCDGDNPCPGSSVCADGLACLPSCANEDPTYCPVQFGADQTCDSTTGQCRKLTCSSNTDCQSINGVCDTGRHACTYDCRQDPSFCCSLGQSCGLNGLCQPGGPYSGSSVQISTVPVLDAGMVTEPDGGPDMDMDAGLIFFRDGTECNAYVGDTHPDAGFQTNAPMGAPCMDARDVQSNCAAGTVCHNIDPDNPTFNFCTKLGCQHDSDCGTNGGLQNRCELNMCFLSCDSAHTCAVGSNTFCQDFLPVSSLMNACLPDCRNRWANYCGYGETCNQTTGACEQAQCAGGCPSGTVCDTSSGTCRTDCRQQSAQYCCGGLSSALLCELTSGMCMVTH